MLTRRGARVVYLTTEGFQDVPHIQRINRKHHYDFHWRKPTPLVHRPDCLGVAERMDEEGRVLEPIDLEALATALEEVVGKRRGRAGGRGLLPLLVPQPRARAGRARDARAALPGARGVALARGRADLARVRARHDGHGRRLPQAALRALRGRRLLGARGQGHRRHWALLKSNGGHALAGEARARPAHLLLSGIAGGAIGGAYAARAAGAPEAIALDMGGTSCDVCLIVGGEPLYSSDFEIEFGLPVSVPSVSTRTIGAGGGSIGWVDPGGFLQVGPQSAGAVPGPAVLRPGRRERDDHGRRRRARPARPGVLPRR